MLHFSQHPWVVYLKRHRHTSIVCNIDCGKNTYVLLTLSKMAHWTNKAFFPGLLSFSSAFSCSFAQVHFVRIFSFANRIRHEPLTQKKVCLSWNKLKEPITFRIFIFWKMRNAHFCNNYADAAPRKGRACEKFACSCAKKCCQTWNYRGGPIYALTFWYEYIESSHSFKKYFHSKL